MPKFLLLIFTLALMSSGVAADFNSEDPNLAMDAKEDIQASSLITCPKCLEAYLATQNSRMDIQVDFTNSGATAPGSQPGNTSDTAKTK